MTDDTTKPLHGKTKAADRARWFSDLHCLWRYCEKRGCQRARACCGDVGHCLMFFMLVPYEAREFIFGWDAAKAAGLSFDEMMEEYAEEWDTLMRWREMVSDTLPENRWKEQQRFETEQRAKLNGQGGQH